jgi:hypothetical protein
VNYDIWLAPLSTLLETLIVSHLFKEFPTFFLENSTITLLIRARYWTLSWATRMRSTLSHYLFRYDSL